MSHGSNEGCGACSILVKNISSLRDKNPKDIIVVMTSCVVKSRLAISIDNVDLCSGFKETSDNISPATSGSDVEGSDLGTTMRLINIEDTSCNCTMHEGVNNL
jgi:hypothetical protein|tara:strand:+ start:368 stop:676 length:309 start_codon:yes stop_codon:yes gene_type:complete